MPFSPFKPAARYPADPRAVFILMVSVFSGLTTLAVEAAPASLEALLPRWGVIVWSILLCLGSAITLLGMAKQTINGIVLEQVGSVMVGATTVFYSTLAIWYLGVGSLSAVGIILAWGLACFLRWAQLQILLVTTYRQVVAAHVAVDVEEQLRQDVADGFTESHGDDA